MSVMLIVIMLEIKRHTAHALVLQFSSAIHLSIGAVDVKALVLSRAQLLKLLLLVIFVVNSYGSQK